MIIHIIPSAANEMVILSTYSIIQVLKEGEFQSPPPHLLISLVIGCQKVLQCSCFLTAPECCQTGKIHTPNNSWLKLFLTFVTVVNNCSCRRKKVPSVKNVTFQRKIQYSSYITAALAKKTNSWPHEQQLTLSGHSDTSAKSHITSTWSTSVSSQDRHAILGVHSDQNPHRSYCQLNELRNLRWSSRLRRYHWLCRVASFVHTRNLWLRVQIVVGPFIFQGLVKSIWYFKPMNKSFFLNNSAENAFSSDF